MIQISRRFAAALLFLASAYLIAMLLAVRSSYGNEVARVVKYAKEDIVPVRAKLRYSTLLVLPDNEEILDFTTGDKEFWIINGVHNLCYLHPAQAGLHSRVPIIER